MTWAAGWELAIFEETHVRESNSRGIVEKEMPRKSFLLCFNDSRCFNYGQPEEDSQMSQDLWIIMVSTAIRWLFLVVFIGMIVGGNMMVFLAVASCRRLWRITNCFVVSLAVTDLLLGVLVLPLSAILELRGGKWPLGGTLCNIYISLDVFLCTSSILNLLAISVDRYLAISAPLCYSRRITPLRVTLALIAIWSLSLAGSFVPIFLGWNTADYRAQHMDWDMGDEDEEGRYCKFEWNNNYVLVYTIGSFYLPLLLMCGMYLCIFRVAQKQARRIRAATPSFARAASNAAIAREHKATVTLAVVLGAFIICWAPYFTIFTCMGINKQEVPPNMLYSVVLWLGYFNSLLNPILYPALNRDFRRAYGELLCCRGKCRRKVRLARKSLQRRVSFAKVQTVPQQPGMYTCTVRIETEGEVLPLQQGNGVPNQPD